MGSHSDLLGEDAGDVAYPYHLVNGRTAEAPESFRAKPGDRIRIRIRIVNAGGDTAFRVALGGHEMTVTHTDGFPVEHAKARGFRESWTRSVRNPYADGQILPRQRRVLTCASSTS